METETVYSTRLNKAFHRCGNVFPAYERCTMFVNGLDPSIRALVARHREEKRKLTYLELVQYAQAEGDTLRARQNRKSRPTRALLADGDNSSLSLAGGPAPVGVNDNIHFRGSNPESMGTSELPSTSAPTTDEDPALYTQERRVPAASLPFANTAARFSRPEWRDTAPRRVDSRPQPNPAELICYLCYLRGDKAPDCTCPLREGSRIIAQYEALTPEEKARVPSRSYEEQRTLRAHLADRDTELVPANGEQPVPFEAAAPNSVGSASK
ncbi:unnamed protein product, partial [Agarophyton chilense]